MDLVVELLIFMDSRGANTLQVMPGDAAIQARTVEARLSSAELTYSPLIDIVDYESK